MFSAAVVPVNSIAWICAWTKTAGFSSGGPVSPVRHRAQPDVAPLVGVADRLDREQLRMFRSPRLERLGQLGVRVEAIEPNPHPARA